jgi:hypothetical protein
MQNMLAHPVFSVGETDYRWRDVVAWARWRGQWAQLEDEIHAGLAVSRQAARLEWKPDPQQLRRVARQFRYKHRLIAADDLASWLHRWGVTAPQWTTWLRQQLLREAYADPPIDLSDEPAAAATVEALLWPAGVFSGRLANWAREVARRAAVGAVSGRASASPRDAAEESAVESAYREFCDAAATPRALQAAVTANRQGWTRIEYGWVKLASAEAAREALLCLREDGAELDTVADLAGVTVEQHALLAEQLDILLRQRFLSAVPGDVVDPVVDDTSYAVAVVTAKEPPTTEDPAVRARAAATVAEQAVRRAVEDLVRWHHRL